MTPAADSKPILDVRDLRTHFPVRNGVVKAVDGVSFTLHRGQTVCIVGESGSGKSVTARSILQIVERPGRIEGGQILFNRDDGTTVDLAALHPRSGAIRAVRGREIAMIFQEPMSSLSPVHTIGNQIMEVLQLHLKMPKAQARARAVELLKAVEIPKPETAVDRYTFEFSGGMRQRAMIAMALACDPAVLIADEPTTALDVTTQAEILDLIARLQEKRGTAVIFITHDMGVVAEIADEVVVMYHGKVVERGPVETIFHAPQDPYTQMLLGSVLKLEQPSAIRAARAPMPAEAPPLLEIRNLKMYFPIRQGFFKRVVDHVKAVDDVTLDVKPRETLGIVGESGSGKTTLGRCLLRVYDPTEGSLRYRRADGSI
ncbi:MAG: ABC transporter ATP-binding protein, partial [Alphaproteobacteria bacterium]|nr:ABC transporter ATP-binding protein [Alphaproteobacteria bacterium]